jgi:hypothetical protein
MHELLAPTKYVAAFWVVGFLVIVSGWTLLYTARARSLIERLCIEDEALWKELGEPTKADELGRATNWPTLRRVPTDDVFAGRFNPLVVTEIRRLQRWITAGLVILAALGSFMLYLAWPYR